ncbi:hypothetical protein ACF07V_36060 [Streptomyces sp. NPDC015661]
MGSYLKSTGEMYAVDSSDARQKGCRNTLPPRRSSAGATPHLDPGGRPR